MIRHNGAAFDYQPHLADYVLSVLNTDSLGQGFDQRYVLRLEQGQPTGITIDRLDTTNLPPWVLQALEDLQEFAWQEFCCSYAYFHDLEILCPTCGQEVCDCEPLNSEEAEGGRDRDWQITLHQAAEPATSTTYSLHLDADEAAAPAAIDVVLAELFPQDCAIKEYLFSAFLGAWERQVPFALQAVHGRNRLEIAPSPAPSPGAASDGPTVPPPL